VVGLGLRNLSFLGSVIPAGYTDPDQVTTTGQAIFVTGTRLEQIQDLSEFIGQPIAYNLEFDPENRNWIFPDGDHLYIPVDPLLIEGLSRGLYKLVDPDNEGLFAGIIWHPGGTDAVWPLLQLREVDQIPISLQANTEPLAEVLQAFVEVGGLTQPEVNNILAAVSVMAGEVVLVRDFIPESWQPYVMTKEQAIAGGWLTVAE
jgi:hypothetical protein